MPLQPEISEENLKSRIANRSKEIPEADNEDGSFNLDGYKYKPGDYDKYTSWWTFAHDAEKLSKELYVYPYIDRKSSFLDVGALCGSWTLPILKRGASVTSIEPDPNFYKILKNNIKLNGFKNWKGMNVGVYDQICVKDFYDMKDVNLITLDSMLDDFLYRGFSYIKMDVEGAEVDVLKGGHKFLKANRPILWIECHEEDVNGGGVKPQMVKEELLKIFGSTYIIDNHIPVLSTPHIFATPEEVKHLRYRVDFIDYKNEDAKRLKRYQEYV